MLLTTQPPQSSFTASLPWVLLISMMFFLANICRMLLAPLLLPIEQSMHFTHTTATSLLMFTSLGAGISLFANGFISSRLPHRRIIALSVSGYGIALLLLSHAQSLHQIRAGFLICGLAGGLYFPSGMASLASITDRSHWGKTIAVHEMAPNLAFILAPVFAETVLHFTDWRGTMRVMAAVAFAGAAFFTFFGRGGESCGEAPNMQNVPSLMRRKETWIFMALVGVGVSLEFGPYSVLSLFLVGERHMSRTDANTLISATRLATPFLALVGGWFTDKVGAKPLVFATFAASVIIMGGIGFMEGNTLKLYIFLQASMPALMFPGIFKLFADAFPAKEQPLVLSMTMPPIVFLTVGGVPAMLGLCGDMGSFGIGFTILGGLCFGCLPLINRFGRSTV